jgi:hypothetical protein
MRTLQEIAFETGADWQPMNNSAAREALRCMETMGTVAAPFAADPNGYAIFGSFLVHAIGWRGEVARRVKRELREMSGHPRP